MDEYENGGKEQIYDHIEDSDFEKCQGAKLFGARSAVRGKKGTAAQKTNGATEVAGNKNSFLLKLKEKFRSKSSEDDNAESQDLTESSLSFAGAGTVGDATVARRRALTDMHHRAVSFPAQGKASVAGASTSRAKTLAFGKRGRSKHIENENVIIEEHNYEHVEENSCGHLPNSCSANQHKERPTQLNTGLPSIDDSCAPPISDRPRPVAGRQEQRRRAQSLTLPLDQHFLKSLARNDSACDQSKSQSDLTPKQGGDESSSLSNKLEKVSHYGWYWGPLNRREAELVLKGKPDGSFLVRDSSNEFHLYSVSFRSKGRTIHTRIKYDKGHFGFATTNGLQPESDSVGALVRKTMKISQRGPFYASRTDLLWPSYPIQFLFPVSRFEELPSLKHLCRFVIRQYSRCDRLQELPLPPKLIRYINVDNHFLPEAEIEY